MICRIANFILATHLDRDGELQQDSWSCNDFIKLKFAIKILLLAASPQSLSNNCFFCESLLSRIVQVAADHLLV